MPYAFVWDEGESMRDVVSRPSSRSLEGGRCLLISYCGRASEGKGGVREPEKESARERLGVAEAAGVGGAEE